MREIPLLNPAQLLSLEHIYSISVNRCVGLISK